MSDKLRNLTCVCGYCGHHDIEPMIEFNFRDLTIYFMCSKCQKQNVLKIKPEIKPYPKTKVGLR